jgi:autotransporter-associated beta strand protein
MEIHTTKRNRQNKILVSAALAAAAAATLAPRLATAATWTGGGGTGSWQDPSNWGGVAPVPPEQLIFDTSTNTNTTDDFADLTTFNGIVFASTAGSFTLAGTNRVALGADLVDNSTNAQLISLPLALNNTYNFSVTGGAALSISGVISDNGSAGGINVTNSATSTLTLTGANTYTGPTVISSGTLQIGDGGSNGSVAGNITNNANLVFNRSDSVVLNGTITGTGANTFTGSGIFTLAAANSYSGRTTVSGGSTLVIGAAGTLGNGTSALVLGATSNSSTGNLDLSNASATVSSLTVTTNTTTANAITIGSGRSLTVTGNTTIGGITASPANTLVTVTGAGTLTMGNGTGSLTLNNYTANGGAQTSGDVLDVSGLATFVANYGSAGTIAVGGSTTIIGPHGGLILGGDNTLTAGTMLVGHNTGGGSSGNRSNGYIKLGTTNKIYVDNITVGGGKPTNQAGVPTDGIVFNNTAAPGQTVKFRGSNGTSAVTSIKIADATGYINNSGTASVGLMDFNGGSLDMLVTSLTIGLGKGGSNTAATNATMNFYAGSLNATTITLGKRGTTTATTTGNLNVNGPGVVTAGSIVLGDNSLSGSGTGIGNLNINGGSVTMTGNISSGGGTANVNLNGGTLNMQGNNFVASGTNVILNGQSGTLLNVGQINGGGTVGLTKSGTGTLTLNGTNTYTAPTNITGGTLSVLSSVPATDNVSGGTLAGTGNGGNLVLSSSGVVYPGLTAGDIQTLSANSLSVTGGTLKFDLGPGLTSDLFSISGAASFTAPSTISIPAAPASTGVYTVLSAGTLTLSTAPTVVGPAGTFLYSLNTSTPNQLKINVTLAPVPLTWNGFQDQTTWENVNNGKLNWTNGTSNTFYGEPALVTFDDTAPANTTNITLNTSVAPATATFNSENNNYTISGTGSISGAAQIIKSGSSTLTLLTNNTYGGPTTINAGTVMIGNGGTTGSLGTGSITNNGIMVFNRSDTVTLGGAISGTGDLQQVGAGTLVLTGNSSYSGLTTISSGTLQVGNGGATAAIGSGPVTNNSLLAFNRSGSLSASNVIGGTGSLSVTGGVVLTLTGASNYAGNTTISGGSTIAVTSLPTATNNSGVGAGTTATATPGAINLDGGTLRWARVGGNQTSDRIINIGPGGGTLDSSPVASQSLTLSNAAIGFVGADGPRTLTLTGLDPASSNFSVNNLNSQLVDPTGGVLTIVKNGTNGWSLGNAGNSFTGSITINAGMLRTGVNEGDPTGPFGNNSVGSATSISVANGAQVRLANPGTYNHPISLAGVGVPANELGSFYGAASITAANVELAGPITLTGDARITVRLAAGTSGTVSGQISGAHALELGKGGQNTIVVLANTANNWTGGTQISMGTTQIGAPSTATSGVIPHGAGAGNVTIFGGDENGDGANSTLDIGGNDTIINGLFATALTPALLSRDIITGGATLTVGDGNQNGSYAGTIINGVSISKIGTGTQTLAGNNTYSGSTNVSAGALVLTKTFTTGSGVNLTGGALRLASDGTNNVVLKTPTITTTVTGKLDVNDNKLIIPNGNAGTAIAGTYDGITGLIQSGYNPPTATRWDGAAGITTTQTQATTGNLTSIAVAKASDVRPNTVSETALWGGLTIAGNDVLVMYTYGGDATLDGKINIDDYVKIDSGIAGGYTGWVNGDFNYDGKVSIDDYITFIDANIGNQNGFVFPTAGGISGGGLSGVTAVPEPAALTCIGIAAPLLLRRRRRR